MSTVSKDQTVPPSTTPTQKATTSNDPATVPGPTTTRKEPTPTQTTPDHRAKRSRLVHGERIDQADKEPPREHPFNVEEQDSVMNPRETRGLPKRATMVPLEKNAYPWPDPLALPDNTIGDPHSRLTRDEEPAPAIPKSRVAFTDAIFQRLHIPLDTLVAGLREQQAVEVKNAPENFLALIPYGAGHALYNDHPKLGREVLAFLKTLRFADTEARDTADEALQAIIEAGTPTQVEAALRAQDDRNPDTEGVQIIMPTSSRKGGTRDRYALPWAMFLRGGSERLWTYLLYQQTFAVRKDLAFSVLKIEAEATSWVLCNFKGEAVDRGNENAIMSTIKRTLWKDDAFRQHVTRVLTKQGVPGDINDHAVHATRTFTLTFFDNTDAKGQPATVVQLRGQPIATTEEELGEYLSIIRLTQFWVNMVLLLRAGSVTCQLCKAVTHPAYDCPFFKTEGWFGPQHDGAEKHADLVKKTKAKNGKPGGPKRSGPSTGGRPRK
ncbi:hypothetical protein FOMPIDRAFT_1053294 [Fomitopsis schrenkii]|uniref:Uncharacterized protein n=1 Tax=Fomitopsis schrenkii TaxID=2126942 RepID=S8FCX8_FOMSC|nr:hypothetical protein FOMPIDRAFT_1053294 [Fomitopsis schrenkii]